MVLIVLKLILKSHDWDMFLFGSVEKKSGLNCSGMSCNTAQTKIVLGNNFGQSIAKLCILAYLIVVKCTFNLRYYKAQFCA